MTLNDSIRALCERAIEDRVFPGTVVGYIRDGKQSVVSAGRLRYGNGQAKVDRDTLYDLASITKSIPTSSLALRLIEQGRLSLDDRAVDYIPELAMPDKEKILIRHLLTYTVQFALPKGFGAFALDHPNRLLSELFKLPLQELPGTRYYYTNPPALLVGLICERIYGKTLDVIADEEFFRPLNMHNTSFLARITAKHTAPSEIDWRGEVRGSVHDESAWVLANANALTGHAGLFSTVPDLLIFARMLLAEGALDGRRYFRPETVALMHTNQLADIGGRSGLGWDLNQPLYMGNNGSDQTFGKTGFRSTMIVIEPVRKLALVQLSNANYPHRAPDGSRVNAFRQQLSNMVFAA